MISIFGNGFIGKWFSDTFPDEVVIQDKDDLVPQTNEILFFISTVDNYNVFGFPELDIITNEILPVKVLQNARQKFGNDFTFNFISSWFVYGDIPAPYKEDSLCNPNGFYSITKLAGEQLGRSYCETFGARYRILRLGSVMGVGDTKASLKKNAVQFLISEIAKGKDVEIYDEPSFRDIIDVRDCVQAIHLALSAPHNTVYNIANGESVNVKVLLEWVAGLDPEFGKISYIPVPEFHKKVQQRNVHIDTERLHLHTGYLPKFSLEDTVKWIINSEHDK